MITQNNDETQSYESMPLPPSTPKKKIAWKKTVALIALALCLSGLILGVLPMIIAGGPMELAYQSGYSEPVDADKSFDPQDIKSISFPAVSDQERHEAINKGVYLQRFDKVHIAQSKDENIHISYVDSFRRTNKISDQAGDISISAYDSREMYDDGFQLFRNNLYILFAGKFEYDDSPTITIQVPKSWDGVINLPELSHVYSEDVEFAGSISTKNAGKIRRFNGKGLTLGGDLLINSENISLSDSTIVGSLEALGLVDEYAASLYRVKAGSLTITSSGNVSLYKVDAPVINVESNSPYIYAYFDKASTDYDLHLFGSNYADCYLGLHSYSILPDEPSTNLKTYLDLRDMLERNYRSFDDGLSVPEGELVNLNSDDISHNSESLRSLMGDALTFSYQQTKEAAPQIKLVNLSGAVQVGFGADNLVYGYKKPYPAADIVEKNMSTDIVEGPNLVTNTLPLNLNIIDQNYTFFGMREPFESLTYPEEQSQDEGADESSVAASETAQ